MNDLESMRVIVSGIANSCNIGADFLDGLADGRRERPAIIHAVAAGLRDATKNVDPHLAEMMHSIISGCEHYFSLKESGANEELYSFFEEQIKRDLQKYRSYGISTFDDAVSGWQEQREDQVTL